MQNKKRERELAQVLPTTQSALRRSEHFQFIWIINKGAQKERVTISGEMKKKLLSLLWLSKSRYGHEQHFEKECYGNEKIEAPTMISLFFISSEISCKFSHLIRLGTVIWKQLEVNELLTVSFPKSTSKIKNSLIQSYIFPMSFIDCLINKR